MTPEPQYNPPGYTELEWAEDFGEYLKDQAMPRADEWSLIHFACKYSPQQNPDLRRDCFHRALQWWRENHAALREADGVPPDAPPGTLSVHMLRMMHFLFVAVPGQDGNYEEELPPAKELAGILERIKRESK